MKIKTIEATDFCKAIEEMKLEEMEVRTAYKLLRNEDKLRPFAEAYGRLEQALMRECKDPDVPVEDGRFKLLEEKADYFFEKRQEAMDEVVDVDLEMVSLEELKEVRLSLEAVGSIRICLTD